MRQVVVKQFGGTEVLQLCDVATPTAAAGQVLIRLTSIGMNHADLMGRRGEYKLSTGDPPYTPGLEGGGLIEAVGEGVGSSRLGERVTLAPDAVRGDGRPGTYGTHYVCDADEALVAPDALPDEQLGAVWLPYLTAWGGLLWKANLQAGEIVACPAASSSTALAAAQIAKRHHATTIGLTTSPGKVDQLETYFDHVVVTHDRDPATGERTMRPWHREMKQLTGGRGVDVFFDPVAAGAYLSTEVRCLAQYGRVVVYGLLGAAAGDFGSGSGGVDVTPLIRKHASIVGYVNDEVFAAGRDAWMAGVDHIFGGFASGAYQQTLVTQFALDEVQDAHAVMEQGGHIGKMVLIS